MNNAVLFDLKRNQNRLNYYIRLQEKVAADQANPKTAYAKWIEIYSERVRKLEAQVQKLGLKTNLTNNTETLTENSA